MRLGPLFVGWERITESERIEFGCDPWPLGWEALHVEWRGRRFISRGFIICVRPIKGGFDGH